MDHESIDIVPPYFCIWAALYWGARVIWGRPLDRVYPG